MYDTIVIPADGSEHSTRAAEHGLALARHYGSTVHAINVVDVQRAAGLFSAGGIDEAFVDKVEAAGREAVRAIEKTANDSDDIRSAVVQGSPWKAPSAGILEYATDHDAELIVMGTHGRTGLNRTLVGSVTEQVVRSSSIPVLTVRATDRATTSEYDEILVPTDGSDASEEAVEQGVAAAASHGAKVRLLHVVDVGIEMSASGLGNIAEQMTEMLDKEARNILDTAEGRAEEAGVEYERVVLEGFPDEAIVDYSMKHTVDLIVMGITGRSGIKEKLLGGTTNHVLQSVDAPVLTTQSRDRG